MPNTPEGSTGHPRYRTRGDPEGILAAADEVRHQARLYLDSEPPIDRVISYHGSIQFLRETGLRLSYALMRIAAHYFIHAGEIVTIRSRLGHDTDQARPPRLGPLLGLTYSLYWYLPAVTATLLVNFKRLHPFPVG